MSVSNNNNNKKNQSNVVLIVEVIAGKNLIALAEGPTSRNNYTSTTTTTTTTTAADSTTRSDPYVIVKVGKQKYKTKVLRETQNPVWDIGSMSERFIFKSKIWTPKESSKVVLKCMDYDRFKADDRLGMVTIPLKSIEENKEIDQWYPLKPQKPGDFVSGELHVRLQITDMANEFQPSELWKAVKRGNDEDVGQLLQDPSAVDLTETDSNGETLLHLASKNARSDSSIISRLLSANISVTQCDKEGNSPLHTFCRFFAFPSEILQQMIDRGADVNAVNVHGETPLHHVVFNPSIKLLMAELLLKARANPNAVATNKDSPLHYAIQIGRTDLVKLLIAYGADCNLAGSKGKIAVPLAKQLGLTHLADVIQDSLQIQRFLQQQNLSELTYIFLDQEIYLYHLEDIPDSSLAKFVKNKEHRDKILAAAKDARFKVLERKETFLRKQENDRKRYELRKKESQVRNVITSSIPMSVEWEIDISDLEFITSLGQGASGSVYRGTYQSSIPVAIKVLKASGTDPETELKEFQREFNIALSVSSPHIVHFYGATMKNKLCLVMEFCDRGSMHNVLKDAEFYLDWDRTFSMLEETTLGILALHDHNPPIVHRDLKTLNVLVTHDYKCKVCDFGLSRFDSASNAETLMKCRGTYAYIAPEVYSRQGYSKQSDVYSLSIIMWEVVNRVLTGDYTLPYSDVKPEFKILILAHTQNKRPNLPDNTPPAFVSLLNTCWNPDVNVRPNAHQVLKELENIKAEYQLNKEAWDALCKNKRPPPPPQQVTIASASSTAAVAAGSGAPPKIRRRGGGSLSQATPLINGTNIM